MSVDDIAQWARTDPSARDTHVFVAARGPDLGPREWLSVFAILRRYGDCDARYREVEVGSVRVTDEACEREALEALYAIARSVGATLEVRAPGWGQLNAAREWIERAAPAPMATWTVKWRGWSLDEDAREVVREDVRRVEARACIEARNAARTERIARGIESPDAPVAGGSREELVELEETFEKQLSSFARSPHCHAIRIRTSLGDAPTVILEALGPSRRDAVCALADAWMTAPRASHAAGAFLRGELGRADADHALREVARKNQAPRTLALRIEDALARDQFDRETVALARENTIATIRAMRDVVPDLSLGDAKRWGGELLQVAEEGPDALFELGVPSRTLAVARSRVSVT